MDKKEIKKSLLGHLPRGFSSVIAKKIYEKTGKKPSASYISRVVNSETEFWNDDIIEEALGIAAEQKKKTQTFTTKAAAL
ncbi:hypothetical protein KHS38_11960 [Mucilaginibacter sp. Bleaf8]|uniref:hypothetical protein n=1 Tax=Mucilaginibacter sp. Bleaf8 TaxID=2834430 RepID=UPI001BCB7E14|nr:hypothetical protein [Mucilaginibacter sp. Bleaf8]MBS7565121.1 hypothetical protein [Mucilaginibacter sp. Bleaf8]